MDDFTAFTGSYLSKQGHDQGLCNTGVKVTHIPTGKYPDINSKLTKHEQSLCTKQDYVTT